MMKPSHYSRPYFRQSAECNKAGSKSTARFWKAVRHGDLRDMRDMPCADCGRKSEMHDHRDYDRWWDIDPVCRGCNIKRGRAHPFYDLPRSTGSIPKRWHNEHLNQFALSMLEATTEPYDLVSA